MDMSRPSVDIPGFLTRLSTTLLAKSPSPAQFIVPLLVSVTCGRGSEWVPHIYTAATRTLPPAPALRQPSTEFPSQETVPRRLVVRQMKEALQKASILIGVPKTIEARLELEQVVEPGAKDDAFPRQECAKLSPEEALRRGRAGLDTIYRDNLDAIFEMMGKDMQEVAFMSQQITYGFFLTPFGPSSAEAPSRDPLAFDERLLSIVTLSCLVPQRTRREILWHLRGAIRRGMKRDEVEAVHQAIADCCDACGMPGVREGMPVVAEVEPQKEELEE
ncbi:hypothetical protein OIV83_001709 [Microbotryomycetes sp. JL201]|nr:hypothetical protein OIV83_001709 [Microbotryomycetes sp. JL201]